MDLRCDFGLHSLSAEADYIIVRTRGVRERACLACLRASEEFRALPSLEQLDAA